MFFCILLFFLSDGFQNPVKQLDVVKERKCHITSVPSLLSLADIKDAKIHNQMKEKQQENLIQHLEKISRRNLDTTWIWIHREYYKILYSNVTSSEINQRWLCSRVFIYWTCRILRLGNHTTLFQIYPASVWDLVF